MPVTKVICPDGEQYGDCMNSCRMGTRCAPLSFIEQTLFDREWTGITASMAGNGVRQIYLKKNREYAVSPLSRVFAILGTGTHANLAKADYNKLVEEKLPEGTADLLEPDPDVKDHYIVTDFKTWGSFKVAKALGLVKDKETKQFKTDPEIVDLENETYQLNNYRLGFERCGFKVSKLRICAIVRDGNTYMAKNRGITEPLYLIYVPLMDDESVKGYYNRLACDLAIAEKLGYSPICDDHESWDYRRCDEYCEVSEFCEQMSKDANEPTWKEIKNGTADTKSA